MDTLTAEILERVPLKLRNEYAAAWEAYASTCRMGGAPAERSLAYERARKLEDKHHAAVQRATAAFKRDEQRRVTSAP